MKQGKICIPLLHFLPEALDPVDQRVVIYIIGDILAHLVGDGTIFLHDGEDCFLKSSYFSFFKIF